MRYFRLELTRLRTENSREILEDDSESIVKSYTKVPGMPNIELPFAYKYFEWYYPNAELQSKKWVIENVKENWNIIDIGANIGYYSILFSRLAREGKVWACEPTGTFEMLEKNIQSNKCQNIVPLKVGFLNNSSSGAQNLYKMWGKPSENVEADYLSLDDFVDSQRINSIDLIKIDTDGFELEILRGAKKVLEVFNPYLMVEFSYALNTRGWEVGQLLEELIEQGFSEGLLLDHNNLILRKSADIAKRWTKSFTIFPHSYDIKENSVNKNEKSLLEKHVKVLREKVTALSIEEYSSRFFPGLESDSIFSNLNPRLPGRGPKMEVNDAPLLSQIYRQFNPKRHLEFGTWEGFGVNLVCDNSEACVTTINLSEGEERRSESGVEKVYTSSNYPYLREKFVGVKPTTISDSGKSIGWLYKHRGYADRVKLILRASTEIVREDFENSFDSIFIDGGHTKEVVQYDTNLALSVLNQGGIIIWHDFTLNLDEISSSKSTHGVLEGITASLDAIKREDIDLFWVENTWLLIGHRKSRK